MVDQYPVKVISSEHGITIGSFYFKYTFSQFEDRHVKSSTSQVIHDDCLIFIAFVQPISERSRGRFIDDSLDSQSRNLTSFFCRLRSEEHTSELQSRAPLV